ncbi:triacylglycerol lipase 1-like [Euphorbia lathyris]|uniref:triacylglycerol lipase 1-like n=1 Tax=Euphorbia lathyris TaxID=212925 RepID=UPI0033139EDC
MRTAVIAAAILCFSIYIFAGQFASVDAIRSPARENLCDELIIPAGYPCTDYTVQTRDGYLLGLQRISSRNVGLRLQRGPPVLLQHGLFMAGDAWFLGAPEQSLGYLLADQGFDVWAGSVRGTFLSHGHVTLSEKDKEFWDWTWEDMALYDLSAMIGHIYSTTNSKVFVVGHSQGTIMSWAAFTQPNIVEMVQAAALLCPISYLKHITAPLPVGMVAMHLDQMILGMGIHQLDFKRQPLIDLIDFVCGGHIECNDILAAITGPNCCMNMTHLDFFFNYEPHPTSSKNMHHLFQMIRQGTFARYDYGILKNMRMYGQNKPPVFDLRMIPKSLPIWLGYGGSDGLADITDVMHTYNELPSKPQLHYLEHYGHVDFLFSTSAKEDVFDDLIAFFRSVGNNTSSSSF